MTDHKIAIVGGGLIGRAWAAAFVRSGKRVAIWSRNPDSASAAKAFVADCLPHLAAEGMLGDRSPDELLELVDVPARLEQAIEGAGYIQENYPEDLDLKRDIYRKLDQLCAPDSIIASSASALPASSFTEDLAGRGRCLVVHPINPPYLIPATEVIPSPWTDRTVVERSCEILIAAGQKPVVLSREIDGFVVNRLQGALLNEAFRLVGEGYVGAEDIDIAVKHGLAMRWSFMGPFETIDLNAPGGVVDYVARYDGLYSRLLSQMQGKSDWSGPVLDMIDAARRQHLPIKDHDMRQEWRDRRLMALAAHKREAAARIGE